MDSLKHLLHDDNDKKRKNLSPLKEGVLGKQIGEGSHATIHEVNEAEGQPSKFLVKIGKTAKYSPPIARALKLSFSRERMSRYLEYVLGPEFKINPDEDFVNAGIAEYLLMRKYFNYEANADKNIKPPEEEQAIRRWILVDLKNQNSLFYKEILKILGDDGLVKKAAEILDKHQKEDFIPKEKTIIGHPPDLTHEQAEKMRAAGKKLPITYYLFQERVKGVPIYEIGDEELVESPEILEKILTFAILAKKMYFDTGKLIDTRPDEIAKSPLEWFQKTSNILVDKENRQVFFIDTRWLWSKNSILGSRLFNVIENFGVRSIDRAIKKYLLLLRKSNEKG